VLETLRIAAMGKVKVKAEGFPLSEASTILGKLKKGEVTGRAVLVP
jgi:D-arabinose 1-dehydrogenase-like Zn-dependent alcohol dehydrogenase